MIQDRFARYSAIAPPPMSEWKFTGELRQPCQDPAPVGKDFECWKNGVKTVMLFPDPAGILFSVFPVLQRIVEYRGGRISSRNDAFPLILKKIPGLSEEEFIISISAKKITLSASDSEGMRRAVYALEEKVRASLDGYPPPCRIRRKPWIRNRISRCFFGPTNRPPFCIDELLNDVDYYPEAYLDRLASEGINGLWLTMYFRDLPSKTFASYGQDHEKRLAKLKKVCKKCAEYGIRIFIFFSEPKYFGPGKKQNILDQNARELQLDGSSFRESCSFCNASKSFAAHIRIPVETLFREVPQLGGIINIMYGEDNGSCATLKLAGLSRCKRCAGLSAADLYREYAEIFLAAMHKYNPAAQFIGWFYTPAQRDDDPNFAGKMAEIAEKWPGKAVLMLNFESGSQFEQLGKKRIVYDYSLAAVGPSQLFSNTVAKVRCGGAKLQVCTSHENASVPFIPVPGNLYRKYRAMRKMPVNTVMQCWYFGNYPGLMNRGAGRLSFTPFPASEKKFLQELAAPAWGKYVPQVIKAWDFFGKSYRNFPANIAFAWYGPLHNSIAWPWHVMPQDSKILPSWLLDLKASSGDRIGEVLGFHHTLDEALELCGKMDVLWQKGIREIAPLIKNFRNSQLRTADISPARAIGLQIASAKATLQFYDLREKMFFERKDLRSKLAALIDCEIKRCSEMITLCRQDSRLGYHPEAENFLFFPEKLAARINLLKYEKKVLEKLDIFSPEIDRYTGRISDGTPVATADGSKNQIVENITWRSYKNDGFLIFELQGVGKGSFCLEVELCRLFPPVRLKIDDSGALWHSPWLFREIPSFRKSAANGTLSLGIPWDLVALYRRKNQPLRVNISGTANGNDFAWVKRETAAGRLLFDDYDPTAAGWLIIK